MNSDEADQRAAEQRAADLFQLGWENGAGAAIWARAAQDELMRHEEARAHFSSGSADREAWDRLHSSTLMLVVAIEQVLAFEKRLRRLTGDAELTEARRRFDAAFPHAEAIRDIAAHLDAYAVGQGDRQTGRGRQVRKAVTERNLGPLVYWTNGGGTVLELGDELLNLRAATSAAVTLAAVVERVRDKWLERTEAEANAAFRRRWGLDQ